MTASAYRHANENNIVVSFNLDDLVNYSPLSELVMRDTTRVIYIGSVNPNREIISERLLFFSGGFLIRQLLQDYEVETRLGPMGTRLNTAILEAAMQR